MKVVIDIPEVPKNDKQRWALTNGTPYEERPQWIPCSERLPEAGTPVIFCNHHGEVTFGERLRTQGKSFIDFFTSNQTFATAWMPLPKPYEKEGDMDG